MSCPNLVKQLFAKVFSLDLSPFLIDGVGVCRN